MLGGLLGGKLGGKLGGSSSGGGGFPGSGYGGGYGSAQPQQVYVQNSGKKKGGMGAGTGLALGGKHHRHIAEYELTFR